MKLTQLAVAMAITSASASALAATYSVTPLPLQDVSVNNFGQSIDESGYMVTVAGREFNQPIDADFLEPSGFFKLNGLVLENEDDVKDGIFSNFDYSTVISNLRNAKSSNSIKLQHLSNYRGYISDGVDYTAVNGFDKQSDYFDGLTRSVDTFARNSLNGDYIVGTSDAPTYRLDYVNKDDETITYVIKDFVERGFVEVDGVTHPLLGEDDTLGGLSDARAINSNFQVAGSSAIAFIDAVAEKLDECEDDEKRGDIPVEVCSYSLMTNSLFRIPSVDDGRASLLGHVRATIWQLDASGEVISSETYPLLFEPDEEDTSPYWSIARDINNTGLAVGATTTDRSIYIRRPPGSTTPPTGVYRQAVAVSYINGETTELLNRDDNILSEAIAVNDNNWVTGNALRAPNDVARNRLFVHNIDTGETVYPQGFFMNAGVEARAINNNNIVVGRSENDSTVDRDRERHGFMYDIASGEMTDLNDLLPCDSEYTIVDGIGINDNNEILANARYRTPRRYANGKNVVNDEGETTLTDTIVAVKLSPIPNGEIESCEIPDDQQDDVAYERKGASVSLWWLALLSGVSFFRRRRV